MRTRAGYVWALPLLYLFSLGACSGDDDNPMQSGPVQGAGVGGASGTPAGMAGAAATAGTGTGSQTAGTGGMGAAAGQGSTAGMGAAAGQGAAGAAAAGTGAGAGAGGTAGTMAGAGGSDGSAGTEALPPLPDDVALPLIFVHGFAGSAQQYQSQAMRFVANGYPLERIIAYDHDGAGFDTAGYANDLDDVVDAALAEHGAEQVYLVAHSRGTFVSSSYLGSSARAAKVAKYVAIDGSSCPAGSSVPCIAPNQAMFPGQAHVEVATSPESFEVQYEFLVGEPPQVVEIVRQRAPVEISGRAVNFPANTGRAGVTLQIWEIASDSGARATAEPLASFEIGAGGDWGPAVVDPEKHYEFVLIAEPPAPHHHHYMQPFLRSTRFVRLLSGPPDSATRQNTRTGDGHTALIVSRMREWMAGMDVLEISSTGQGGDQAPVDAITSGVGNANIAVHIHDDAASPGESSLAALPYFSSQAFQYGVDVYMPAADPPAGTITVRNLPRGDSARPQVLNVPNWPSSGHAVSLLFSDFAQD